MKKSIRTLALAFTFVLGVTGAGVASAEGARKAGHVIVVGIDGMSPDGLRTADTPTLTHMMENGSWSVNMRGVLPTTSSANWASLLTGVGPEEHGVTSNDWRVGLFNIPASVSGSGNFYPSIFQVVSDQQPDWEVGSVYNWQGFSDLYDRRFVDYDVHGETEEKTAELAADYIRSEKPQFLFVHLDNVDHVGHAIGHGTPEYYAAVAGADRAVGQIWQAVLDAGIADETVILVTSDHGGVGKGHGGETLAEIEIPWIVYGGGVKAGQQLDLPMNITDTAATSAWLLGLDVPYAWRGRPVRSVMVGEDTPSQAYRISGFYASPKISPAGEGNTPAGGLFINTTAEMSIENPNSVGEIRYTLDGSIPTASSLLYSAPVEISRNTLVTATLFVAGEAASVSSVGYFRVVEESETQPRGLDYNIYLLPRETVRLPDFSTLEPAVTGVAYEPSLDDLPLPRDNYVGVVFEGQIQIEVGGTYNFSLASDDGSKLYIGGKTVVDNDGDHGVITASGNIKLEPGQHDIRIEYFNGGGGSWLGAYFSGPGIARQFIDPNLLTPN